MDFLATFVLSYYPKLNMEGERKDMFYLMTHLTHLIYGHMASDVKYNYNNNNIYFTIHSIHLYYRKEGNVLFNDALNTFYLQLYDVRQMVKDHSDSERENQLLPHGLLFLISSKGSFICTIPQTG